MTAGSGLLALAGAQAPTPSGAGYDLVLLAHIVFVFIAFGVVAASGVQAARLLGSGSAEPPGNLVRYYAPGVNWAGRSLIVVPILGVVLIAMSRHAYGYDDRWVQIGIGLWFLAALAAEGALWPAERRLQGYVAERSLARHRRTARQAVVAAAGIDVVLVVVSVIMVAKP